MVAQNDFFRGIGDDLVALASNLKQTLEETNKIEPSVVETDVNKSQNLENNSPQTEN